MSLISRIEVTNYLTEGINPHRRSVEWQPMLTGITLRLDGGKSALVNITNGGGKTSLVELLLYLLSRDSRLLQKIREKAAPKNRGFTHGRIEFRTPSEDSYTAPSLLEIDPENLPGQTHVVGVVLNDDINDPPIFYSYSGTLEDSPCYIYDGRVIASVPDVEFVTRTKALHGSKWNKFTSRREWEDHIRLFLPIEVIRRNVVYQLKGSDDKNASFFDFTTKGGESYDSAFFRSVVAPDLLSNLLSTFSEEDELAVEDTLLKSLSRIVDADREIVRKEHRLGVREKGIAQLSPILEAGKSAQALQIQRDTVLRSLRKDVALLRYFGLQGSDTTMPGIPRCPSKLGEQDSRILMALGGMVITRDEGILLLDKTLGELSGVEVGKINEAASRRGSSAFPVKMQVIDFNCDFENFTSGSSKGGHYRKGYPKSSALAIPEVISGISGARTSDLEEVLVKAFLIAEAQIDTNPASREVRRLEVQYQKLDAGLQAADEHGKELSIVIERLTLQIKDRQENQGAWDDFVRIGNLLPDEFRSEPARAKCWVNERLRAIRADINQRNTRRGELSADWSNYQSVLEHHGLQGLNGARERYNSLIDQKFHITNELQRVDKALTEANASLRRAQGVVGPLTTRVSQSDRRLEAFLREEKGFDLFVRLFGEIDPTSVDPLSDLDTASKRLSTKRLEVKANSEEADLLSSLRSQTVSFNSIFGDEVDPTRCDPVKEHTTWTEQESAARESMALLGDKKEAIDLFDDLYPGDTPANWLEATDSERARVLEALGTNESCIEGLKRELKAIDEMRSVEDGAFEQAWTLLNLIEVKAQRLHQAIQGTDYPVDVCSDILSALSGLLSAPVFDSVEDMQKASSLLQTEGVAVPLVLRYELFQAISMGLKQHADVRWLGFIGGNTSRRVRILLDTEFAQSERNRLKVELTTYEAAHERLKFVLPKLLATSEPYQLALKAKDALAQDARNKYLAFEVEAKSAEQQLAKIKPRMTAGALEVLRCAKEFILKDGHRRIAILAEQLPVLNVQVSELEAEEKKAKERASQQSLNARDSALKYQSVGGKSGHQIAIDEKTRIAQELEAAQARLDDAGEHVDHFVEQKELFDKMAADFDREQYGVEIDSLKRALEFADNDEYIEFMKRFEVVIAGVAEQERVMTDALRVNFERAESFKSNQEKSDQDLSAEIAEKQQGLEALQASSAQNKQTMERIQGAEIPMWSRLSRAIHELAYEIGSRVARTASIAEQADDLEEGKAVPEAHPAYRETEALLHTLQRSDLEALGYVVEQVESLSHRVQEMDFQMGISRYKQAETQYKAAMDKYEELNGLFCTTAESAFGSPDAAFNMLEIEEIKKAAPTTMRSLVDLFGRLQSSLDKERDDAKRAKRVAEETNEDTVSQLSRLIVSAEDNLAILNKVMRRYSNGRFFFETQVSKDDKIREIIDELKQDVERASRDLDARSRTMRRGDETQLKRILRDKLIECVFTNTRVEFVNAGIWGGKQSPVSEKLSTGQKIALEFMWIVRQAEYEIERGLLELTSKQAARSRAKANRVILIDGIFSTLSDRKIIREALNGLRDLGGNFQIVGFLHSPTWTNDYSVFPVYHVGKKLMNSAGDGLVSFMEQGRAAGTVGFFSTITQPSVGETA